MSILEGAYWISSQKYGKYLKADADGTVHGVDRGPRGIDILDSVALRARIWLVEKYTDGEGFRLRNYETGFALGVKEQSPGHQVQVTAIRGNTKSQVWKINQLDTSPADTTYQIKNVVTSTVLRQLEADDGCYLQLTDPWQSHSDQMWSIEPVTLPSLYWLTNSTDESSVLHTFDRPNASDGASAEVTFVCKELSARAQLWTFEYTSLDEAIIRSGLHHQFVLDLASDSQTVLAHKYHGGSSQIWRLKDEDEQKNTVSLANTQTGTSLTIEAQNFFAPRGSNMLVATLGSNMHLQIHPSPRPPLFWVTIQNPYTGAFLAQADGRYIIISQGVPHPTNHRAQWRFIMVNDGIRYVIENRATGFVLDFDGSSISAKDENRDHANSHWMLDTAQHDYIIVNAQSNKILWDSGSGANCRYSSSDYYPGPDDTSLPRWIITPSYGSSPSFALVNALTGQCLANSPIPDAGTVSGVKDINNFCSQWMFYSRPDRHNFALLNKMSGNNLEPYMKTRVEAYRGFPIGTLKDDDIYYLDSPQCWELVPLSGRQFVLFNESTRQSLYDPNGYGSQSESRPDATENQAFRWYLVSHRESSFDFLSLDFDILQKLLAFTNSQSTQIKALQRTVENLSPVDFKVMNLNDNSTYIRHTTNTSRTINDTLRVILAHLIEKWAGDSIPKSSEPRTIVSATRNDLEKRWDVCFSERVLRRRSDEPEWVRIELQSIHDVDGEWVANIQGKWLDLSFFQVIVPVDTQVGRTTIQRAMLQSLDQRLTVEVRATPPEPAVVPSGSTRPGVVYLNDPHSLGLAGGEEKQNSLIRILDSIEICSLRHDSL